MTIKRTISVVMCVVFLAAVVCPAGQDKVDLKLRLKAGESHEMKMTGTQDGTQTVNGQEIKQAQTDETVIGLDVLKVDANGVMDVAMTYKSIKMTMDGPIGHIEFDSVTPKPTDPNRPQEKNIVANYAAMVGCKFQMKVKPTGEIYDIRGIKEMNAKVKERVSNSTEAKAIDVDNRFSEKQLKDLAGRMMRIFPAEPVAIGDTWYITKSTNLMMPIDIGETYTLKSRKNGIAYIDAVAKIDGDSSKNRQMGSNEIPMQISGTTNWTIQVDEKTGLTRKCNMITNCSGIMKIEVRNAPGQYVTMPITMKLNDIDELIK
jgi:hypothetical protein